MGSLSNKKILLGVTGGIAAYKAAELVRLLVSEQASVRVVMTGSAQSFVGPLTFQALTGNPVATELLDADEEASMGHIRLARWADCIVIAPATAGFIAKMRIGLADDLLSTLCLAANVPLLVAPAMNRAMWSSPATVENIRVLRERGIILLGPGKGFQACGEQGYGRMLEPDEIVGELDGLFLQDHAMAGLSVLVTAGPTREPIDPVRYITNRSSGKMGYEVAWAAARAGASVTLVSGPVCLPKPDGVVVVEIETADEMYRAVMDRIQDHDIYISAAAVADYSVVEISERKMKKSDVAPQLLLMLTRDILANVAGLEQSPFTVGFAAETDDLEANAKQKLAVKKLDMIVANQVGGEEGGFESDNNALSIFWKGGNIEWGIASKKILAGKLIALVAERYSEWMTLPNK